MEGYKIMVLCLVSVAVRAGDDGGAAEPSNRSESAAQG